MLKLKDIIIKGIKRIINKNKIANPSLANVALRVRLSLFGSVSLNIIYVLMQLTGGILYREVWFYALAVYYGLLIVMRIFLLKDASANIPGRNKLREFYRYRFCGFLIMIITLALSVIVLYIVRKNRSTQYHIIHTVAQGAYTIAYLTIAIVNVIKYRKFESPVMSAAKAISLVSATVSVLSLEKTLITAFNLEKTPEFRRIVTGLTGGAVCLFVMGLAIYMITRANKNIKSIKKDTKV